MKGMHRTGNAGRTRRVDLLAEGQACAERCARNYARWYGTRLGLDYADFVSDAYVTVLEHEPAWDPTRGVPFAAYIYPLVRAAMRALVKRRRRELAVNAFFTSTIGAAFGFLKDDARRPRTTESRKESADEQVAQAAVRHAGAEIAALGARLGSGTEAHRAEIDHGARAKHQITRCLVRLPVKLRRLWRWHYVEGRAIRTFAHIEGISATMAVKLHDRLLARIKRALQATRLLAPLALTP